MNTMERMEKSSVTINTMEQSNYYHMYANGDEAKNFIVSESDYRAEFNLIGVCAYNSGAGVLAFSLEDTHPHLLLYGTHTAAHKFKRLFERSSLQHILSTRKTLDNVSLECQLDLIDNQDYLMNVGTYVIAQATKDGRPVMPYDYLWGTGSMYFRNGPYVPVWYFNRDGSIAEPVRIGNIPQRECPSIRCSRMSVPDDWLVCNGLLLPSNYVNVKLFEDIYRTHNCFRTFLASSKKKDQDVRDRMAFIRGIVLEDIEARRLCESVCMELYSKKTSRWLDASQRLTLAKRLRNDYRFSFRQLSSVCRLPEEELRKYLK